MSRGRFLLAAAVTLYVLARFGIGPGVHMLVAAALFTALDAAIDRTPNPFVRAVPVALQAGVIFVTAFAPAPFGFGSVVPGPAMLQSPFPILVFAWLASRIADIAATALAVVVAWFGVLALILHDPATITRATIRLTDVTTVIGLLKALNVPHYFNYDIWQTELLSLAVFAAVLGFFAWRVRRLAQASAEQEAQRGALAAHFSPRLVDTVLAARLAPQTRDVAVLDCDLVGVTAYAEKLSPERVADLFTRYRAAIEEAVFGEGGAIFSYAGDGAVAVFGLDGATDPAAAALRVATTLIRAWNTGDAPPLVVGLDAGPAFVGLVGSGRAISLLMLGAPVDGAARLQAATRRAGTPLLVGSAAPGLVAMQIDGATAWRSAL